MSAVFNVSLYCSVTHDNDFILLFPLTSAVWLIHPGVREGQSSWPGCELLNIHSCRNCQSLQLNVYSIFPPYMTVNSVETDRKLGEREKSSLYNKGVWKYIFLFFTSGQSQTTCFPLFSVVTLNQAYLIMDPAS